MYSLIWAPTVHSLGQRFTEIFGRRLATLRYRDAGFGTADRQPDDPRGLRPYACLGRASSPPARSTAISGGNYPRSLPAGEQHLHAGQLSRGSSPHQSYSARTSERVKLFLNFEVFNHQQQLVSDGYVHAGIHGDQGSSAANAEAYGYRQRRRRLPGRHAGATPADQRARNVLKRRQPVNREGLTTG